MRRFGLALILVGVLAGVLVVHASADQSDAGQLYTFGYNFSGQLGNPSNNGSGNPNPTPSPVSLPGATGPVVEVAAGAAHSLAVTSSGQLYAFGANLSGQLGSMTNSGTLNPSPTPALVSLPGATGPVVQVAAGVGHSLAVTSAGQLYAFGSNVYGELGSTANNGTANANPTPTLVTLPGATGPVVQVAAGASHSLAITSTGQLYAFGYNNDGELGVATNNGSGNPNPTPVLVSLPGATGPVVQIAAGFFHSLAVTSSGQLYAFGSNRFGQLGTATNSGNLNPNPTPVLISLPGTTGPVVQVAAGEDHSLAVTSSGQLYAFGSNRFGQLGTATNSGTDIPNPSPVLVSPPGATGPVVQAAAGVFHSLAITSSGQLYAFGDNRFGQLGSLANDATDNPNPTPALVSLPRGVSVETIARGPISLHSLVVLADLAVATGSLTSGTVGAPYHMQLRASGGIGPYRWSASGLPAGLSSDSLTGTVSGTPTQAGAFTVQVTVSDPGQIVATRSLTLAITPAPPPPPPVLSRLTTRHRISLAGRLVHGTCRPVGRSNRHGRRCRLPLTLKLTFTMSAPASVTASFVRLTPGRQTRRGCIKPTKANHNHHSCIRLTPLPGEITRDAGQGADTITITHSSLPPGTYQLILTPQAASQSGTPKTITLDITG